MISQIPNETNGNRNDLVTQVSWQIGRPVRTEPPLQHTHLDQIDAQKFSHEVILTRTWMTVRDGTRCVDVSCGVFVSVYGRGLGMIVVKTMSTCVRM